MQIADACVKCRCLCDIQMQCKSVCVRERGTKVLCAMSTGCKTMKALKNGRGPWNEMKEKIVKKIYIHVIVYPIFQRQNCMTIPFKNTCLNLLQSYYWRGWADCVQIIAVKYKLELTYTFISVVILQKYMHMWCFCILFLKSYFEYNYGKNIWIHASYVY